MTATTCPHCGAPIWIQYGTEHDPLGISITYECGDSVRIRGGQAFAMDGSASFPHGPACRMIRALRISQLKRMADAIDARAGGWADVLRRIPEYPSLQPRDTWRRRWLKRMEALHAAVSREIARLEASR